jgi:hypothetical protein
MARTITLTNEIGGQERYTVRTQAVNPLTEVPDWVEESDSPQVGRICDGTFYYLGIDDPAAPPLAFDRWATRRHAGHTI